MKDYHIFIFIIHYVFIYLVNIINFMGQNRFSSRINIIIGVNSLIDRFNSNNLNQIHSYFFP